MICIIRIKGRVGLDEEINQTMKRLRLKRKYSCVVVPSTKENLGMVKKLRNFIAFGKISQEMLEKMIEKRGKPLNKEIKIDSKKFAKEIIAGKKMKDVGLYPVFRLHPPIKGIDTKIHFGKKKGVLGDNKEKINNLVERML